MVAREEASRCGLPRTEIVKAARGGDAGDDRRGDVRALIAEDLKRGAGGVDKWNNLEQAPARRAPPALELRREEPMARTRAFRIGGNRALWPLGPAAASAAELETVCARRGSPARAFYVVGNGTNLLVSDGGLTRSWSKPPAALRSCARGRRELAAGCGAPIARGGRRRAEAGLSGLEFAGGIPVTVGGAVTINAAPFGGEMKDVVLETAVLTEAGKRFLTRRDHGFRYRGSARAGGSRDSGEPVLLHPGDPAENRGEDADFAARRRAAQPRTSPARGALLAPAGRVRRRAP
jgi:UDP-N-acetylmuramate dehydrogenase